MTPGGDERDLGERAGRGEGPKTIIRTIRRGEVRDLIIVLGIDPH